MFNPAPNNEPRDQAVKLRMSATEHAAVSRMARARMLTVSDFIRWQLTLAVRRERRRVSAADTREG